MVNLKNGMFGEFVNGVPFVVVGDGVVFHLVAQNGRGYYFDSRISNVDNWFDSYIVRLVENCASFDEYEDGRFINEVYKRKPVQPVRRKIVVRVRRCNNGIL